MQQPPVVTVGETTGALVVIGVGTGIIVGLGLRVGLAGLITISAQFQNFFHFQENLEKV